MCISDSLLLNIENGKTMHEFSKEGNSSLSLVQIHEFQILVELHKVAHTSISTGESPDKKKPKIAHCHSAQIIMLINIITFANI